MAQILQFSMADGTEVFVEVNDLEVEENDMVPVVRGDDSKGVITKAQETFEEAFSKVRPAISYVTKTLRELQPDELQVKLAISFNAKAGVLAQIASGATFDVTLTWANNPRLRSKAEMD